MKELIGRPSLFSGLALRTSQCAFAAASIGAMISASSFSEYTAFCYLIASIGLQLLWSLGLACLDIYALRRKRDLHNPILVSLFVVGDWVTATLPLAAACASAGVIILFARDFNSCKENALECKRWEKNFRCGRPRHAIMYLEKYRKALERNGMDYINTPHPNFIGGTKAVEVAIQQIKSSIVPMPISRVKDGTEPDKAPTSERSIKSQAIAILARQANGIVPDQAIRPAPDSEKMPSSGSMIVLRHS